MHLSNKIKISLVVYVFLILTVPIGAYLASESRSKNTKTSAKEELIATGSATITKKPVPTSSPIASLIKEINELTGTSTTEEASDSASPTIATTFGPSLNITLALEGRPTDKQATKAYIGIRESSSSANKADILSFTTDVPDSGKYSGLSLAGLTSGSQYMAVIKPTVQLAKIVMFTMLPSVTELNNGSAVTFLTGDLNEDNVINTADYSIERALLGTTPKSSTWNVVADFNKDDIVNQLDLAIVTKNMGQTGESGVWVSPVPSATTSSGALSPTVSPPRGSSESEGYWIWVPK